VFGTEKVLRRPVKSAAGHQVDRYLDSQCTTSHSLKLWDVLPLQRALHEKLCCLGYISNPDVKYLDAVPCSAVVSADGPLLSAVGAPDSASWITPSTEILPTPAPHQLLLRQDIEKDGYS
jgi:hypothetical protein